MRDYIILNGTNSNTITGLLISSLPSISKPLIRTSVEEIDGRDGDIVTKLGYAAYDKTFEIGLYGNYDINQVIAYFNSEGTVIFSNEPDKYYKYQILDQIDFEKLIRYKTATVTMHVQPFKYKVNEDPITKEVDLITGEGTEITLNNTIEVPFASLEVKGNTVQDGTPTPENPIEIKNVEGKNIASLKTSAEKTIGGVPFTIEEGIIKINGTTTQQEFYFDSFQTKSNTALFWVEVTGYTDSTVANACIILQESTNNSSWTNTQLINLVSTQTHQYQVTLDSSKYYRIRFYTVNNTYTNATIKIQLEYGTVKTDFVPYGCIGIKKVNKNIFNCELELGNYSNNGTKTDNNSIYRNSNFINVKPETTYTLSINGTSQKYVLYFYDENKTFISMNSSLTNGTFTTPSNAYFINFRCFADDFTSDYATLKVQLEEGQTATDYIEHEEQTYNFPLSEGQKLMQGGTIDGKVNNVRNHVILDGVTTGKKVTSVNLYSSSGLYYCICNGVFNDGKTFGSGGNVENLLSSHFTPATGVAINHCYRTGGGSTLVFILTDQTITTVEQANTWLAQQYTNGTPVEFEYPLATPNETDFTEEQEAAWNEIQNMSSYNEVTHIYSIGDLPAILNVSVYGNNTVTINNSGNIGAKPTFTIYGKGNIGVYLNEQQLFEIALGDEGSITIDTANMEAYNQETGLLRNRLVTGDYNNFVLNSGSNTLSFTGIVSKIEVSNYSRWL